MDFGFSEDEEAVRDLAKQIDLPASVLLNMQFHPVGRHSGLFRDSAGCLYRRLPFHIHPAPLPQVDAAIDADYAGAGRIGLAVNRNLKNVGTAEGVWLGHGGRNRIWISRCLHRLVKMPAAARAPT